MKRVRRRREPGWRRADNVVYVGRPSPWGNPVVANGQLTTEQVVYWYRGYALEQLAKDSTWLNPLRGHDLECWCDLCPRHQGGLPALTGCPDCQLCHADVLLSLIVEQAIAGVGAR